VAHRAAADPALAGTPLEGCLRAAVSAVAFPATDGQGTTVTWPFVLDDGGRTGALKVAILDAVRPSTEGDDRW
jgi:hypothetical protein